MTASRLSALAGPALRMFRRHAQLIFQNPFDALNPRFTIQRCLNEPLINAGVPRSERATYIERALDLARLSRAAANCCSATPINSPAASCSAW